MATEYVLVSKKKLEQMEQGVRSADSAEPQTRPQMDTGDHMHTPPPPPPPSHQPPSTPLSEAAPTTSTPAPVSSSSSSSKAKPSTSTDDSHDVTTRHQTPKYARRSMPLPQHRGRKSDEVLDMDDTAAVASDSADSDDDNDFDVVDILQSFTSAELPHVQPILKLMEANPKILTWDTDSGEIVFQTKTIPNSNVVELLKDTITGNLHPVGKMEFFRALDMLHVKLATLKHPKSKALLAVVKGDRDVRLKQIKKAPKRLKPVQVKNNTTWLSW